jgi:flagellar protein FliO/FliZ
VDISVYIRFILALAGVLALIAIAAFVLKRVGWGGMTAPKSSQKRLAVTAAIALDGRRRLVLVRRDDVEHLLLVGGPADLVVESGIGAPKPATNKPIDSRLSAPPTSAPPTSTP